ncbi:shikimate dehydrogenase [Heyndrickxia oleronia]|jgi:shikimate dehydrogenase|uniref:shikimate dehydrogenase n=1 Tax=Heyndrickxia oleronia TaxID=38875 RepID=UPI000903F14E|nr:shikimate dehydrogenase [Heyndrickxia oleronia]NYV64514.1 shikimate dehydrogenase [Bacillus sp. Gen3]OJH18915.1 shikimate dehydrogenase [Bacillus obstructivus]MCI1591825.1 shikimate dehydrogenase [Heyndrickxia oleronia]MCI1614713.1 shikimate dehydrogenase [Heyndrickxia oleronia]MCI1745588.1 shikimate dehydrogenase [Heyndrickxia oleronia]
MANIYGVIGDPIAHSLSPLMHTDAFRSLNLDHCYFPFHVTSNHLEEAVKGMKVLGIAGFNVTIPHKTNIIPLLDQIDPLAKAIGAVNTVVRENDSFVGYNSDGLGFIRSLKEEWKRELEKEKVLIIGAGGAAKAIFYSLVHDGVQAIDICNRTTKRAKQLVESCPYPSETNILTMDEAEKTLDSYSLIVQTTSIGMSPNMNETPLSIHNILPNTHVVDIIYNPFETALLKAAKEKGASTSNGLGMFIYQGAIAFEKWTGKVPDVRRMKQIVINQLGGQQHVNR